MKSAGVGKHQTEKWELPITRVVHQEIQMPQAKFVFASVLMVTVIVIPLLTGSKSFNFGVRAQEGESQRTRKWEAFTPVSEADEPVDAQKRTLRQAKNRRYNSTRAEKMLTEQPQDAVYGRLDEAPRPPALPVRESDAVILGTVIEAQPYLTETKTSIYTEFRIRVEEAFKCDVPAHMIVDQVMLVDQEGGALRLKTGQVLRYFVGGTSRLPTLNGRYVLFVSLTNNNQDLAILTGYELLNGAVISLENSGDKSAYANWDEGRFFGTLRNAVTHDSLSPEVAGKER
jgi:hypothetical protein